MATSFSPLTTFVPASSTPVGHAKPVNILSKTQAVSICSPLFKREKKSEVPHPPVPLAQAHAPAPGFNAVSPHRLESAPQVTFQRQGDLITHIRIQCSCGQVIELACEY